MLYNSQGEQIVLNTVTQATFRGLPIVACSGDYNDPLATSAWNNLLVLAARLNVAAFHIDLVHDITPQPLFAAIGNIQRFYSGPASNDWIHSSGSNETALRPVGPLFYLDLAGGALAITVSTTSVNFRRNHFYEFGMNSIWPVLGEDLDQIQRPPIHQLWANMWSTTENWFLRATLVQWQNGGIVSTGSTKVAISEGVDLLATKEAQYPGISRHIYPPYANSGLFVYPWFV